MRVLAICLLSSALVLLIISQDRIVARVTEETKGVKPAVALCHAFCKPEEGFPSVEPGFGFSCTCGFDVAEELENELEHQGEVEL